MKVLTRAEVSARKDGAVAVSGKGYGDPDRADEVSAESIEGYAARRHFKILNSEGRKRMAKNISSSMNMQELQDYVADLEDQLDAVYDIVSPTIRMRTMTPTRMSMRKTPTTDED